MTDWKIMVQLLREIAADKGITHQDIADTTGLQRPNVTRFFSMTMCPTMDTFLAIAKAIGVNFFFESKNSKTDLNILFEQAMTKLGRRDDPDWDN